MFIQRLFNRRVVSMATVWMLALWISPRISLFIREAQIGKIMIVLSHSKAPLNLQMTGITQAELQETLSSLYDA